MSAFLRRHKRTAYGRRKWRCRPQIILSFVILGWSAAMPAVARASGSVPSVVHSPSVWIAASAAAVIVVVASTSLYVIRFMERIWADATALHRQVREENEDVHRHLREENEALRKLIEPVYSIRPQRDVREGGGMTGAESARRTKRNPRRG